MEELLVGNSVILLFWVYITFMVDISERFKVIVLMYLITFLTNILNIVPTLESYVILVIALFLQIEFFEDNFKKVIITNWLEKIIDFAYILISEYSFVCFTLSLILSSEYVNRIFDGRAKNLLYSISIVIFCFACNEASSQKYVVRTYDEIKKKIDSIKGYRQFLVHEKEIVDPYCVLCVEDANFFEREDRYSFANTFYLKKRYFEKLWDFLLRLFRNKNKINNVKRVLRGYSTIEMQLLRTLAIKEGYDYFIRRKVFEILYAQLFWKNLKNYYKKCGCSVKVYKDYLLYLYLRIAPCLNRGQEKRVSKVIRARDEILEYTREELFVLALCFSGKVKRDNIMIIYEDLIDTLDLDVDEVSRIIEELNN